MNTEPHARLSDVLNTWAKARPFRLCVLFGSQATGAARAASDVDVAVWPSETPDLDDRLRWIGELMDLTGREVSLVIVTADTNPTLGWEIVRNGVPIYEREPGLWPHLRMQRWHVYNDALTFRRAEPRRCTNSPKRCAVAPEVVRRKLAYLRQVLADLAAYRNASSQEIRADHYAVERMLELLVMTAVDLLTHLLVERGMQPDSYRTAFKQAGETGLLPTDLADRLAQAAGLRNVLVHMYERIDYAILARTVGPALDDFAQFVALLEPLTA